MEVTDKAWGTGISSSSYAQTWRISQNNMPDDDTKSSPTDDIQKNQVGGRYRMLSHVHHVNRNKQSIKGAISTQRSARCTNVDNLEATCTVTPRRRSSRGYCNWGSRLRRHPAYGLVLKCLSRVFDLLTGSVHWRRNQRRLAFNRASQQRSHTCLQVNGGSGRLPARPGFFILLDSLRWWLIKGIYNWLYAGPTRT